MTFVPTKTVKIGGEVYSIEVEEGLFKRENRAGMILYWPRRILLDAATDQIAVLIHEITHGLNRFLGKDESEEDTCRLACALTMLLADNPVIFRRIIDQLQRDLAIASDTKTKKKR